MKNFTFTPAKKPVTITSEVSGARIDFYINGTWVMATPPDTNLENLFLSPDVAGEWVKHFRFHTGEYVTPDCMESFVVSLL